MPNVEIKEEEIEAAERIRGRGEFATALRLTQEMLSRAENDETRMRLLFDVLYCSTRLGADDITQSAMKELDTLPDSETARIFADFIRAVSNIALGKAKEALDLINCNLRSDCMARVDLRDWKYEHLAYKGRALAFLQRWEESLASLNEAYAMVPDGQRTTDILIDKSLCMMMFNRYGEAFSLASRVLECDDGDMKTLAMQYMAESDLALGKVREALELYSEIKKQLPSRLVQEERIEEGINKCMAYLERSHPPKWQF